MRRSRSLLTVVTFALLLVPPATPLAALELVDPMTGRTFSYTPSFKPEPTRPSWRRFDPASRRWVTHTATDSEMAERHRMSYARAVVPFRTAEPQGTIIVDTVARYLYLVNGDGTAIRYGVGVGREGFTWSGVERVTAKAEWPDWRPPAEMRRREPHLPAFMAGGLDNPLGARALYLGDTPYRIHGTHQDHTIGYAVSSGCIRMLNEDVIDLYARVRVGAEVIVLGPKSDRRGLIGALAAF